jgi:hypothetical protein
MWMMEMTPGSGGPTPTLHVNIERKHSDTTARYRYVQWSQRVEHSPVSKCTQRSPDHTGFHLFDDQRALTPSVNGSLSPLESALGESRLTGTARRYHNSYRPGTERLT